MKILFMGTDDFAVCSLLKLVESKHKLVGVVTQPDRPSGRGRKIKESSVKKVAKKCSIPVFQPKRVSSPDFVKKINELEPELVIVVAYGQILKEELLCCPSIACINVHPSLLPKYRGAAPIQRSIINGEEKTGVTIMLMDEGEDTGDIITQKAVKIDKQDTAISLKEKLAKVAADILLEVVDYAEQGVIPHVRQNESLVTYAPKLTKEEGEIDWSDSAEEIFNLVRGTVPWPGAYTYYNGKMIKIISCQVEPEENLEDIEPGTVIVSSEKIEVITGDGKLVINELQPESKNKMEPRDFINGYRLKTGVRFGKK